MINNRIQNPNNINNNNQRRPISNRVNNGLTQMEINKIPEEIVQNNINYESKFCSICLNNFKKSVLIVLKSFFDLSIVLLFDFKLKRFEF